MRERIFPSLQLSNSELIGLKIRRILINLNFQPAKKNLCDFPIFTLLDVVRFPTVSLLRNHPERYFEFLVRFRRYKSNLHDRSWSSLTQIYSRSISLWYYYLLFWWAEYCGVLTDLLEHPEYSLIPEVFIRYIVEIDSIIDSKSGKEYISNNIPLIKIKCRSTLKELLVLLGEYHDSDLYRRYANKIWTFRKNCLSATRQEQILDKSNFTELLVCKNQTAGELFRVWSGLLCDLYHVEKHKEISREIFGWFSMGIQVIDDILDSPVDYRDGVSNIFISLLYKTPEELDIASEYFRSFPGEYLDWVWANKHLPKTCQKASELMTKYINAIMSNSENPILTTELCELIRGWEIPPN